ncbi:MAG: hypothetical protein EXR98_01270 [Gemmataceae bacterium]|nr:hypothetical protein [Gemmataceae bacterium]
MDNPPVSIKMHAPERRRKTTTVMCCGCSCCCCCCLHTLGSIVAAAVAPALGRGQAMQMIYYYDEETGEEMPLVRKPGLSAVVVFWWMLCFLLFLGFAYAILAAQGNTSYLMVAAVIIAMAFPLIQLASAFFTAIVFACWPRPDKGYQLKQLAKITGGVVAGSIVGIVAMVGLGFLFAAIR